MSCWKSRSAQLRAAQETLSDLAGKDRHHPGALLTVLDQPAVAVWAAHRIAVAGGDSRPTWGRVAILALRSGGSLNFSPPTTSSARVTSMSKVIRRITGMARERAPPRHLIPRGLATLLATIHIRTGMTMTSDVRTAPMRPLMFRWAAAVSRLPASRPLSRYNRPLYRVHSRGVKVSSSRCKHRNGCDRPRRHGPTDAPGRLEARLLALDHSRH